MMERFKGKALVVSVETHLCALSLANVMETMRPLPIEAITGAPSFVRGIAIVRGIPTPVVDLRSILGMSGRAVAERFVTIRTGDKQVALLVDSVVGIRDLGQFMTAQLLPPLLQGAAADVIQTLGILDNQLLTVLRGAWTLPDEVWQRIGTMETVS